MDTFKTLKLAEIKEVEKKNGLSSKGMVAIARDIDGSYLIVQIDGT